jgi:hypothetical protein
MSGPQARGEMAAILSFFSFFTENQLAMVQFSDEPNVGIYLSL